MALLSRPESLGKMAEAALYYLRRGWSVIPLKPRDKRPALESWAVFQQRKPTPDELRNWWTEDPERNVGVVTGEVSGVVVLDVDGEEGRRSLEGRVLPPTPVSTTGKGLHYWFAHPGLQVPNRVGIAPGLDIRGDGGYVVAPPSIHPSGVPYRWAEGLSPDEVDLAPCPEWILDQLRSASQVSANPAGLPPGVPEGRRNATAARLAGSYFARGLSVEEAWVLLRAWNQANRPPLPERELRRVVESIARYHPRNAEEHVLDTLEGSDGSVAWRDWPELPDDVWSGWFRQFRDWVTPTTDGALEAIFGVAAVTVGLAAGRDAAVHYGRPLFANLYVLLVGPTGAPRKTTVVGRGLAVLRRAFDEDFLRISRSIGSAEGLLEWFCREETKRQGRTTRVVLAPIPGQRVLYEEAELTNLLTKLGRSGTANLQEVLLALYDGEDYTPRTRTRPITVREPFFAMVGATTPENLETRLEAVHVESGLLPRFATFYARPRPPIAYPEPPDEHGLSHLAGYLQDVFRHAQDLKRSGRALLELSPEAREVWTATFTDYTRLARTTPGPAAHILLRVPMQVMKFALIYALQAGRSELSVEDLDRAKLVGDYLVATARLLPGSLVKAPVAKVEEKILQALKRVEPGRWVTGSAIHRLVGGRVDAPTLHRALEALVHLGRLEASVSASPGHPAFTVYRLRE